MKISTKAITFILVILTSLCLLGCGKNSRAEPTPNHTVSQSDTENNKIIGEPKKHAADEKSEPTTFFDYLDMEAEKDNPDALCRLAISYHQRSDFDGDIDEAKACELFQKAAKHADKGIASAQYSRGMCYAFGYGGPQDREKAFQWIRKAADQGFAEALCMLALAYQQGLAGMPQSDEEAVKALRKAAELGDSDAQYTLGVWYCTGTCLPENAQEGYKWIRLAAESGLPEAKEALGQFVFRSKTDSKWAAFIRKIPDSTGILNAVLDGDMVKVKEVIQSDSSLLRKTFGEAKLTLLHIVSVDSQSIEVLKYLIEQNADVRAKCEQNWTPIVYAGWGGNHDAIRYLLANGSLEPQVDCRDFPQEQQQIVRSLAALAPSHFVRSETNLWSGERTDYYAVDLSKPLSIQNKRVEQCRPAMLEIAKAKIDTNLKAYVLPKAKQLREGE